MGSGSFGHCGGRAGWRGLWLTGREMGASSTSSAPPHPCVSWSLSRPLPGPALVCLFSVSGKLPMLFQLCFPVSRLVPKVALWVSGTPGASPVGAAATELTRNDLLGGPAQAWLRQGTGGRAW